MSPLLEVSRLVSQELPLAETHLRQDDSFSQQQTYPQQAEPVNRRIGAFIKPQEMFALSSSEDELTARFVITSNQRETLKFIADNGLLSVLLQSENHIDAAFGQTTLKTLAIVQDDEGYRTLFCLVIFRGTLEQARAALRSFDVGWWLQHARRFSSKLNFDFDLG